MMLVCNSWARRHRNDLGRLDIDIEFEIIRLKYVDILESSPDMMDAVNFANKELPYFHQTHAEGNFCKEIDSAGVAC